MKIIKGIVYIILGVLVLAFYGFMIGQALLGVASR